MAVLRRGFTLSTARSRAGRRRRRDDRSFGARGDRGRAAPRARISSASASSSRVIAACCRAPLSIDASVPRSRCSICRSIRTTRRVSAVPRRRADYRSGLAPRVTIAVRTEIATEANAQADRAFVHDTRDGAASCQRSSLRPARRTGRARCVRSALRDRRESIARDADRAERRRARRLLAHARRAAR